jgi:hypothetical protein
MEDILEGIMVVMHENRHEKERTRKPAKNLSVCSRKSIGHLWMVQKR